MARGASAEKRRWTESVLNVSQPLPRSPLPTRAFQWDLARQVERLDFLLKWLPRYADWGYQELYLHLEDAVEYPSLPGIARRDAYSYGQLTKLVETATRAGIAVVPIVNLLGHTQYLIKVPGLRDLNELRDASGRPLDRGQICPLHPRTLEISGKLLGDMAPFCTAGKVHVGLDESFHLGKCPRCRADVTRRGLAGHFAEHVRRLRQLTTGMGLRMGLWADMLALIPAAIPLLPRDLVAYDWYYYPFARHPRVELRNFAEVDLATPLQRRGIEYWGCPMNGAFRYEPMPAFGDRLANILSWWRRCRQVGAGGFLVTSWEANRLAIELTTAIDAAAACLWLDPGIEDPREMLARGFARVFGKRRGIAAVQAAKAADSFPFSGYHRWQINDRWDVCAGRAGVAQSSRELRALARIGRSVQAGDPVARASCRQPREHGQNVRATSHQLHPDGFDRRPAGPLGALSLLNRQKDSYHALPPALRASLTFRLYLAQRDVFVRRNAQAVFQLRREITRNAALQPALPGGTGLLTRESSDMDQEVHATRRRSETGAVLELLNADAVCFASAIKAGQAAARAMWNRSRDPRQHGPNELMLARDSERLREWRQWLLNAGANPDLIWQATPVCGAWQLQFTVHNFAPALQKVVVERQQPDGTWEMIYGLYTIEFRALAARPRTRIRRGFSVPIPVAVSGSTENAERLKVGKLKPKERSVILRLPVLPASFASLRLAVRGIGQVAISQVALTDGVTRLRPNGWPAAARRILGWPARQRGFPAVDFETNSAAIEICFLR